MRRVGCCFDLAAGRLWQRGQVVLLLERLSCSGCLCEVLPLERLSCSGCLCEVLPLERLSCSGCLCEVLLLGRPGCTELAAGHLWQTAEVEPMLLPEGGLQQNGGRDAPDTGMSKAAGWAGLAGMAGGTVWLAAELMLLFLRAPLQLQ